MESIRNKCRPKHQILILKCYPSPKTVGNAAEAKPNGSELSYLVYYASSRRAKLTKVGTYLERRTAADLYKGRTWAVHVTLGILTAFLNSSNIASVDAFPLFAPYVLRILQEVLGHANDVALVEACLPVWDVFCRDQDHATLAGDVEYRDLFGDVVKLWTGYADKTTQRAGSPSDAIKLRKAGLEAIKSIATAQALASDAGRQINIILPVVLGNLYSQDQSYLATLDARIAEEKHAEQNKLRPSMSTLRAISTNEQPGDGDARAAGGSVQEADRYAEEDAAMLALTCFKTLFDVENRSQVRVATNGMLNFIEHNSTNQPWAVSLVKMACTCTPVQDRFVVLFTAVETLIRSPMREDSLANQLALAYIVEQVLASNINLIGLSVMDILLGLVQHILLLLQLGTTQSSLNTHEKPPQSPPTPTEPVIQVVKTASPMRLELLQHLRQCIVNLAIHVYYTDQISDMVSAILLRLKPSSAQNPAVIASAIEDPSIAAHDAASSSGLRERPNTDGFFSFDTAREVALDAVKQILVIANDNNPDANASVKTHNPVPIGVWEGTQWLLRDSYLQVRLAYVDCLCTWLALETRDHDARLEEKTTSDKNKRDNANGTTMSRRAVSNASARSRATKKGRSTFLQLLHLAIYEDALQRAEHPDSDAEFLILHLLLSSLCDKLGINAARTGLPMVFRLQEDIQSVQNPKAKVRLGSLVHAYFWALSHKFGFEMGVVGTEIQSEIVRRQQSGIWIHGFQVPALPISQIPSVAASIPPKLPETTVESQVLQPFDHREQMIQGITDGYGATIASPPTTPGSPGRSFSLPTLSLDTNSSFLATSNKPKLPEPYMDELMADWTKANLLAAIAAAAPKSASLNGSRTGTASGHPSASNLVALGDHRRLLVAANTFPHQSPRSTSESFGRRPSKGTLPRTGTANTRRSPARRTSVSTSGRGDGTSSANTSGTTRVEELKRVLAGQAAPTLGLAKDDDDSSESMVDVEDGEFEDGEGDGWNTPPTQEESSAIPEQPPMLRLNSENVDGEERGRKDTYRDIGRREGSIRPGSRRVASRSSARAFGSGSAPKKDLRDLLAGIGTEGEEEEGGIGGSGLRAPY